MGIGNTMPHAKWVIVSFSSEGHGKDMYTMICGVLMSKPTVGLPCSLVDSVPRLVMRMLLSFGKQEMERRKNSWCVGDWEETINPSMICMAWISPRTYGCVMPLMDPPRGNSPLVMAPAPCSCGEAHLNPPLLPLLSRVLTRVKRARPRPLLRCLVCSCGEQRQKMTKRPIR